MTLTLDLAADLEQRLNDAASRPGISPDQFVVEVLKQHLPMSDRREQFAALLQSWMDGGALGLGGDTLLVSIELHPLRQ